MTVTMDVTLGLSSEYMEFSLFWERVGIVMDECNRGATGNWVGWQWPSF